MQCSAVQQAQAITGGRGHLCCMGREGCVEACWEAGTCMGMADVRGGAGWEGRQHTIGWGGVRTGRGGSRYCTCTAHVLHIYLDGGTCTPSRWYPFGAHANTHPHARTHTCLSPPPLPTCTLIVVHPVAPGSSCPSASRPLEGRGVPSQASSWGGGGGAGGGGRAPRVRALALLSLLSPAVSTAPHATRRACWRHRPALQSSPSPLSPIDAPSAPPTAAPVATRFRQRSAAIVGRERE